MNMVRPIPFPEELDLGYFGQVMRINGFQSERDTLDAMQKLYGSELVRSGKQKTLEMISRTAGQTVEQFVQGHTMIPLQRAITNRRPEVMHGSPIHKVQDRLSWRDPVSPQARLCPSCISEDVHFHGVSYWRRDHQIVGQVYCPKHRTPLHLVGRELLLQAPSISVVASEAVPQAWVRDALNNEFVTRFLGIASGLIVRRSGLGCEHVARMLKRRAGIRGVKTRRIGGNSGLLLSDLIQDSFPAAWLTQVYWAFDRKITGLPLASFEKELYEWGEEAQPLACYILALAVLFDSSEEALNALFNASHDSTNEQTQKGHKTLASLC